VTLPVLRLDPHIRFRRFEHEGIVVNQTTAEALVVNEVGTRLLEMADGARTLEQCTAALADEFDADAATIGRDVLRFARELVDAGIAVLE
jgi:hypothetical protein